MPSTWSMMAGRLANINLLVYGWLLWHKRPMLR
jgi:hypothetical protein